MAEVWMGDTTCHNATAEKEMSIVGPPAQVNSVTNWMNYSVFADLPSAGMI